MFSRTLALAVVLGCVTALRDSSFEEIASMKEPLVVVFYDDLSSPVISELENVEESTEDFEFYQVDITEAGNRVEARRMGMDSPPYVFVKTVDSGIERMNVPLRRLYISRFLSLVRLVPSPDSVTTLKNAEVLDGLRQQQSLPVFTLFYESSCAHSIKALRTFEQAAGFFRDFIKFAKVDCASGATARALCSSHNIEKVPTLLMFADEAEPTTYTGGRSVAEFETFFQTFKKAKRADSGEQPPEVRIKPRSDEAKDTVKDTVTGILKARAPVLPAQGSPSIPSGTPSSASVPQEVWDRLQALEAQVSSLKTRVEDLEQQSRRREEL